MRDNVQPSYDKQYVRDWPKALHWDMQRKPPHLPEEVIEGTSEVITALQIITGTEFVPLKETNVSLRDTTGATKEAREATVLSKKETLRRLSVLRIPTNLLLLANQ